MAQQTQAKRVSTTVSEDLHYDFREYCVAARERTLSLTDAVDTALREWLDRQRKKIGRRSSAA